MLKETIQTGRIDSVGTSMSVHCIDLMLNKSTRTANFPVKSSKSFLIFPDKRTLLFVMHVKSIKSIFLESVRQGKILRVKLRKLVRILWFEDKTNYFAS